MNLSAKLAYSQLKSNRSRTSWTLAGIALSTAMITAVSGFVVSADVMFKGLVGENRYYSSVYNEILFGLGAVFGSIIIAAFVIVVSNSFRVSAAERIRQFGIIKSVGAEKRQITQIIIYEGLFLALVAVPAGIALGFLVNYIGIQLMDELLAAANRRNTFQIDFDFIVSLHGILISIILSFATVWLSAWIPARKAAGMSAIEAIRGTGEVKIKAKNVRGGRFIGKLFGFEGTLAFKSLKRNSRNFRATVVSLSASIMLFIVTGYFGAQYKESTRLYYPGVENVNVVCTFLPPDGAIADNHNSESELRYNTLDSILANEITVRFRQYPKTTVFGVGDDVLEEDNDSFRTVISEEVFIPEMLEVLDAKNIVHENGGYLLPVTLYSTDTENYEKLCVISTISTNIRSRSREFAVLRSVGITSEGLNRMLNLESLLCSIKSLVYGVPPGILGSYLLYRAFSLPVKLDYMIPWLPILQCTLGVMAITWGIMRYSMSRVQCDNIIETIRSLS